METARYHEVGRGWSKKRPEFQRMLADARKGRFDTIVCWKSDRLSRGMYPAAALMEVVEAHQIGLGLACAGIVCEQEADAGQRQNAPVHRV